MVFYAYICSYFYWYTYFFMWIYITLWYPFIFAQRTPFNISCRTSNKISVVLKKSRVFKFLQHFWTVVRCLWSFWLAFVFFQHFECVLYCLLGSIVADKKSAVNFYWRFFECDECFSLVVSLVSTFWLWCT